MEEGTMLTPQSLFDLSEYDMAAIFDDCRYAWEALLRIESFLHEELSGRSQTQVFPEQISDRATIEGDVSIGEGTVVEPYAFIRGPAIIGKECQIRQGAYIRGNVLTGDKCVIGHDTEVKNSIFLNHAQASHFAYVGDSILGNNVNLGAGTRLANLPIFSAKDPVTQKWPSILLSIENERYDTGLGKLGAILGDDVSTGCNVVMSPGCIVGSSCASNRKSRAAGEYSRGKPMNKEGWLRRSLARDCIGVTMTQ
jgi:NDP-sugar pyrophosphorylase family protein